MKPREQAPLIPDDSELSDGRVPGFYIIDDEVIEDYGARIGPLGVAVYNVLVKHANRAGSCFPSYQRIADLLGISRNTAIKGVALLLDAKLVGKVPRTDKAGDSDSNSYRILPVKKRRDTARATEEPAAGRSEFIRPGGAEFAPPPSGEFTPPVVQNLEGGGANSAPKPDPSNQTHLNHTHRATARAMPTRPSTAASVCVPSESVSATQNISSRAHGSIFSFEQRKAHAAAHGLGPGWLQRSGSGDYDELIADALASSQPVAVEQSLREQSRPRMAYRAALLHLGSILDVNPQLDIVGAVAQLDVGDEDRARLLAYDFTKRRTASPRSDVTASATAMPLRVVPPPAGGAV